MIDEMMLSALLTHVTDCGSVLDIQYYCDSVISGKFVCVCVCVCYVCAWCVCVACVCVWAHVCVLVCVFASLHTHICVCVCVYITVNTCGLTKGMEFTPCTQYGKRSHIY